MSTPAFALPFNTDLYHSQMHTGDIMRPKAKGSMAVGSLDRYVPSREEALKWQNPQKGDANSTANGERLFAINCSPCHGSYNSGKHVAGVVSQWLPGPDLSMELYKAKPDGHFFGYMHLSADAIMPPYGYKLSIAEHWDIVNYIRKIQSVH